MAVMHKVVVNPEIPPQPGGGGGFPPGSFDHMLHLRVRSPGLDPAWDHTLVDAHIPDDRSSAVLTIHSQPRAVLSLDRSLRIVSWEPAAHVRAHDPGGNLLAAGRFGAPLQPGQLVEINGCAHCGHPGGTYRVAPAVDEQMWPHRDTTTGVCRGDIDWQHVTLTPEPQPGHQPTLVAPERPT